VIEKRNLLPKWALSSSAALSKTQKSEDIVEAWDRMGTITSEIITSLMNKEVAMVSKRFKREKACSGPPKKRQKARASLLAEQEESIECHECPCS